MMAVSLVIVSQKPTLLPFHVIKKTSCYPVKEKYKANIEKRKQRFWKWQVIRGSVFYKTLHAASVNEILLFMLEKYWCCFHKDIISDFSFCFNIRNSKNKKIKKFINHILSSHCEIKTSNLKTSEDYVLHNSLCKCCNRISTAESNTVTYKLMSPNLNKCNCLLSKCHICKDFFHKNSEKVHKSSQVKRKHSNSFDQETVTIDSINSHVLLVSPNKANLDELDWKKIEDSCSKTWQTFLVTDPAFSSKKRKLSVSSVESASPVSSHHHILKSEDSHHSLEIQHNSVPQTPKTNKCVFRCAESGQAAVDSSRVSFASPEDLKIHHHSLKSGDCHTPDLEIQHYGFSNSASQILTSQITEKCVSSLESDQTSVCTNEISVTLPEDPRLHFYRYSKQKGDICLKRVKWSFDYHSNSTSSNCGYSFSKNSPHKKQVQQLCINGYSLQDPRLTRGATAKHFQQICSTGHSIQHEIKSPFHVSGLKNESPSKSNIPTKYVQVCRLENENRCANQSEKYKEKSKGVGHITVLSEQNKDLIAHELESKISVESSHLKDETTSDRKSQCNSVSRKKSKRVRNSFRKNFRNRNSLLVSSSASSTNESIVVEQQAAENTEITKETILSILLNVAKNETASTAVSNISSNSLDLKSNNGCESELQGMSESSVSNSLRKHNANKMSDVLGLNITSPIPVIATSKRISPDEMQNLLLTENVSIKCDTENLVVSSASVNATDSDGGIVQKLESVPLFRSNAQKSNSLSQSPLVDSIDMKNLAPNSVEKLLPSIGFGTEESTSLKCDGKDVSYSSENTANLERQIFQKLESVPLFESLEQKSNSVSQSLLINSATPNEVDIKRVALSSVARVLDTEKSASLKCDTKDDSSLGQQIFEKFKSVPLFESDKQKLNSVSQSTVINSVNANEADITKIASDCVANHLPAVEFDTECIPINEITHSLSKLTFITPDIQDSCVSESVTGVKVIQSDTNIDSENVNIKSNVNKNLLIFKSDCCDLHSSNTCSGEINKNITSSMDIFEENGPLDRYYQHLNGMGFHSLDISHITKDITMLDEKSLESFYFLRDQLHYHESVLRGLVHLASEPGTDRGWETARKITEELEYIEGYEVACTVMFL